MRHSDLYRHNIPPQSVDEIYAERRENCERMCADGAREVAAGRYDEVHFYVLGEFEAECIRTTMAQKYPDIKYAIR